MNVICILPHLALIHLEVDVYFFAQVFLGRRHAKPAAEKSDTNGENNQDEKEGEKSTHGVLPLLKEFICGLLQTDWEPVGQNKNEQDQQ